VILAHHRAAGDGGCDRLGACPHPAGGGCPFRVGEEAAANDDLHAELLVQPLGECAGLPINQECDRPPCDEIDEDAVVALAAPKDEVIDAEHGQRHHIREDEAAGQAQERVCADWQTASCPSDAPTRFTASRVSDRRQPVSRNTRATRPALWRRAEVLRRRFARRRIN
jgi:hypothetical protein